MPTFMGKSFATCSMHAKLLPVFVACTYVGACGHDETLCDGMCSRLCQAGTTQMYMYVDLVL